MIRVRGIEIDSKRRAIRHGGAEILVTSRGLTRWSTLVSLILGGGLTADDLCDLAYGHRPDGGPARGADGMRMYVSNQPMKAYYARLGLRLCTTRNGEPHTRYELVPAHVERGSR